MKRFLLLACTMACFLAHAQNTNSTVQQSADNKAASLQGLQVGFVSTNTRYRAGATPVSTPGASITLHAWKGEKVHAQLAVGNGDDKTTLDIEVSELQAGNGKRIAKANITTGLVGYVWTDEFGNGCGQRKPRDFDSALITDPIYPSTNKVVLQKGRVQPVWLSIRVPVNTPPGLYKGTVTLKAGKVYSLPYTVAVTDRVLPPPAQWSFRLDLWQHPAAIARVHKVALWSDAHFALMRKYYTLLAGAGQKNITAGIVHEPWGHQTYDDYPGLIKWTKKKDGSWSYDYSLFDKYIAFVMNCGINQRINCYSMVPWKIAFPYFDESLGKDTVFTGSIGTDAYNAFWTPMLTDFTRHLKAKGWFNITAIAMDERPMPAMQAVIRLLKTIDKNWKIALAGDYHPEIEPDIYDYCIASAKQFPADTLQLRKQQGKHSTWYTACPEKYPNLFTFSPPAEQVWIGWYTAAQNMDGYLRWAYNSWPKDPLHDSRFTSWPAGDTYQVYPGPLTAIRFEKLIEGIQDFEKIRILRAAYKQKQETGKLKELEAGLAKFSIAALATQPAEAVVEEVKALLHR